jgi:hypothetical protein
VGVTLPITRPDGTVLERYYLSTTDWATRTITNADGTFAEEEYPASQVLYDPELDQITRWFDGGMGIISDRFGYTETHLIRVVAVDAAGNETESEPIRVYVIHKEEEEEEEETEEAAVPHTAMIEPVRREEQRAFPPGTHEETPPLNAVLAVGSSSPKPRDNKERARREYL